jgi:hypothetical protein
MKKIKFGEQFHIFMLPLHGQLLSYVVDYAGNAAIKRGEIPTYDFNRKPWKKGTI